MILAFLSGFIIAGEPGKIKGSKKFLYTKLENGDFKCKECKKTTKTQQNILYHISTQHGGKRHPYRKRNDEQQLKENERQKTTKPCRICLKSVSNNDYTRHLKSNHNIYRCGLCESKSGQDTDFLNQEGLDAHLETHKAKKTLTVFDRETPPEQKRQEFEKYGGYQQWNSEDMTHMIPEEQDALTRALQRVANRKEGDFSKDNTRRLLKDYLDGIYTSSEVKRLLDLYDISKKNGGSRDLHDTQLIDADLRIVLTTQQLGIIQDVILSMANDINNFTKEEWQDKVVNEIQTKYMKNMEEASDEESDRLAQECDALIELYRKIPLFGQDRGYGLKLGCVKVQEDENRFMKKKSQMSQWESAMISQLLENVKRSKGVEGELDKEAFGAYETYQDLVKAFKDESKKYFTKMANNEISLFLKDYDMGPENVRVSDQERRNAIAPIAREYIDLKKKIDDLFENRPHYGIKSGYVPRKDLIEIIPVVQMEIED